MSRAPLLELAEAPSLESSGWVVPSSGTTVCCSRTEAEWILSRSNALPDVARLEFTLFCCSFTLLFCPFILFCALFRCVILGFELEFRSSAEWAPFGAEVEATGEECTGGAPFCVWLMPLCPFERITGRASAGASKSERKYSYKWLLYWSRSSLMKFN